MSSNSFPSSIKNKDGKIFIQGKYLGKGGFSSVYIYSSDTDPNEKYAVKIIQKAILQKPGVLANLKNEIRIHRTLDHPNVLKFKSYFEDEMYIYILLELCDSDLMAFWKKCKALITNTRTEVTKKAHDIGENTETLEDAITKCNHNYGIPIIKKYMYDVLLGIEYLHSKNVIHMDIKLGNIMLCEEVAKIADFGLAEKLDGGKTKIFRRKGTPNYISPEILADEGASYDSDIWSWAVMLYAFLFGKPPFETSKVETTYEKIEKYDYTFPYPSKNFDIDAIDLISRILVPRESRLTIEEIKNHKFFENI